MSVRERGVAVVLAMGAVALAAIAATAILVTQSAWARERALIDDHAQARALVDGALDWSRAVLADDRRTSMADHLNEAWAVKAPAMKVERGEIAGYLEDQQGLFNLNNLAREGRIDPVQLARYRRLLSVLRLPDALADALAARLQAQLMVEVEELALVRGYDESVRAALAPFVTALPTATAVNVNTAPAEVLAAVVEKLELSDARVLVEKRERVYFRDVAEFSRALPSGAAARADEVAVASDYFRVSIRARIGDAAARTSALLARDGVRWPAVVWRKPS
ncbi:MAG TPA: type II secretion system minor pseudopilin GspK [Burkholderiales bacterium]|nr:type II secretion system minor pseudopilin GspK [Burkholderiales bacterium]